jgi:stage V sporulation protein SpoVS
MRIDVRPASLTKERPLLITFLRDHLTPLSDEPRFDWLYRKNPAGAALVWIAREGNSGRPVGVAAAFPRWIHVGGKRMLCRVLGDFCIHPAHRSLGPALQLQRACWEAGQPGQIPLCYDFPSHSMMAVYKRMGVWTVGQVVRWVKPLRVDRKVARLIGEGPLAKGVSAVGNTLLTLKSGQRRARGCELSIYQDPFGEEFTELDRRLAGRYPLCLSRTADYLNWRYRNNPLLQYQVFTARRSGRLQAFAVVGVEGQDAMLVDVFGDVQTSDVDELLAGVIELGRQAKVQAIHAPALAGTDLALALQRSGFYTREGTPMVVGTQMGSRLAQVVAKPANWWLTQGDRDV